MSLERLPLDADRDAEWPFVRQRAAVVLGKTGRRTERDLPLPIVDDQQAVDEEVAPENAVEGPFALRMLPVIAREYGPYSGHGNDLHKRVREAV